MVWRFRQVVRDTGAFLPRRAAAVIATDAGFLAGGLASAFWDATDLAGEFFATAVVPGFLAGAFFLAGGVVDSAPQARATIAKVAAQVRIVRMFDVTV